MTYQSSAFTDIKNIYCVGRNFGLHAKELGNAIPEQPLIFSKPTHAVTGANGTVTFAKSLGDIHHEVEIVLWVGHAYKLGMMVEDLVNAFTIGIDFTARDIQNVLKTKGHPWLLAKGFPNSAVLAPFQNIEKIDRLYRANFGLRKNGTIVQQGTPEDMLFNFQTIIDYIGSNLGLGAGDIIFTGTPAGVGPVRDKDRLELFLENETVGEFQIALE